jgi:glycosyltransferase involved in cell wall biosynthesis
MTELSVVIPARNAAATIGEQLQALAAQQWDRPWEVIVVENGSTDDTAAEVERRMELFDGRLGMVRTQRTGLNFARNLGISKARAEHVAIVDADDVVADGWLAAIGEALRGHDYVTGPFELDRLNPPWLASSRGRGSERIPPTFYGLFPYAHGCNLGIHRARWSEVGGFDEEIYGTEDIEFGMRLWMAGCPAVFVPEAVVHYRYRTEAAQLWRQGLLYGRCRPLVARRLAQAGKKPPPPFAGWKSWAHLLAQLPEARSKEGRALLAWTAGNRIGGVVGSVEHRTVLL